MIARIRTAVALFVLLAAGAAAAAGFTVPPTPAHFVTDSAGALSSQAQSTIEDHLKAYEKATGHQIVVWIAQTTGDVPLETWTTQVADTWKVGRKGHDDGAVLFMFMKDRKARIEVGYGLESTLTDAEASRIIRDVIVPQMRAGNVDGAISAGVNAMIAAASPGYTGSPLPGPVEEPANPVVTAIVVIAFILFFLFVIVMIVLSVVNAARRGWIIVSGGGGSSGGWSGGGGGWSGGGGGFSAGGGSFGGGGASGGW